MTYQDDPDVRRHDEPNEYGFAGDATAPEPPRPGARDERDRAEETAVPGEDLTAEFSEALRDATGQERPATRDR